MLRMDDVVVPVPAANAGGAVLRSATATDAPRIHALISDNLEEGHLLPRTLGELTVHATRFLVAEEGGAIVACAELAPLSLALGEVRSLVVAQHHRGNGFGRHIVDELRSRARLQGIRKVCVLTHQPAYFARMGFSIVPHVWLPEKISTDCRVCPLFRRCGQFAMLDTVIAPHQFRIHSAAQHG